MARIRLVCRKCRQRLTIWGTHDDLVVHLNAERLARAVRCHTCGELLEGWQAVRTMDRSILQGHMIAKKP